MLKSANRATFESAQQRIIGAVETVSRYNTVNVAHKKKQIQMKQKAVQFRPV